MSTDLCIWEESLEFPHSHVPILRTHRIQSHRSHRHQSPWTHTNWTRQYLLYEDKGFPQVCKDRRLHFASEHAVPSCLCTLKSLDRMRWKELEFSDRNLLLQRLSKLQKPQEKRLICFPCPPIICSKLSNHWVARKKHHRIRLHSKLVLGYKPSCSTHSIQRPIEVFLYQLQSYEYKSVHFLKNLMNFLFVLAPSGTLK